MSIHDNNHDTIMVSCASKRYPIVVETGALSHIATLVMSVTDASRICVISDSTVAALYGHIVCNALNEAGVLAHLVEFPAGEQHKTIPTCARMLERIAGYELTRSDCIIALGGGVTGDMGGLCAALYMRGIQLIHIPTSLLAMVDSSIGGKTAVDLEAGKNLVGSFTQPQAVIIDPATLTTLPKNVLHDACGEVIKYGAMSDAALFEELSSHRLTDDIHANEPISAHTCASIRRCAEIKAQVVSQDECESSIRQVLNFGHTIGHAIEAASNFSIGHGSCVGMGMCYMMRAAARKGWADSNIARQLEDILTSYELPIRTPFLPNELYPFILHDKKRRGDTITIVLTPTIGHAELKTIPIQEMRELLELGA